MKHFLAAFKALGAVAENFKRKPVTVDFPKVIRPRPERYRASFALLHEADGDEACIGCLQCERICPSKIISVKGPVKKDSPITGKKRSYADDFTLDLSACIFCELCVQVCPADAIVMTREQEQPTYSREDLVLTMDKLYANEKLKTPTWGNGTKLMEMQTPPKPPAPAAAPPAAKPAAPAPAAAAPAAPAAAAPAPAAAVPAAATAAPAPAAPTDPAAASTETKPSGLSSTGSDRPEAPATAPAPAKTEGSTP